MADVSKLELLAKDFGAVTERFSKAPDARGHEELRGLRLQAVNALLGLSAVDIERVMPGPLQSIISCCLKTGIRAYPRTPEEEGVFAHCLQRLRPWDSENVM